ncbi:MAG: hypothetical protein LUC24_00655 [Bacteroidales bacterium]|nr:hypothetical protein [Bacteroidales bacterium]
MKGSTDIRRRPAIVDALAFCGEAVLATAGMFLLFCDICDDSPLVQGIGYIFAFVLTKGAGLGLLWLCCALYRKYTGKSIKEE